MSIEAMKQALEAAYLAGFNASGEGYNSEYPFSHRGEPADENRSWAKGRDNYVNQAIAEAEKQEQGEPVAWLKRDGGVEDWGSVECGDTPLYTTPQQRTWVGLTDEQVGEFKNGYQSGRIGSFVELVKAIEAKLKEKNT